MFSRIIPGSGDEASNGLAAIIQISREQMTGVRVCVCADHAAHVCCRDIELHSSRGGARVA